MLPFSLPAALKRLATVGVAAVGLASSAQAAPTASPALAHGDEQITMLPDLAATIAGEPLAYPSTPAPVISSGVLTIPPRSTTKWMIHPVPAYVYVLQGTLIVEFQNGSRHAYKAGEAFLQCHTMWHRGVNAGNEPVKFLAVFVGAKGEPVIVHPPRLAPGVQ
jgi:quercetin dioxygenase-like cupin family protein